MGGWENKGEGGELTFPDFLFHAFGLSPGDRGFWREAFCRIGPYSPLPYDYQWPTKVSRKSSDVSTTTTRMPEEEEERDRQEN